MKTKIAGVLYLISTPIGNLEDFSFRAMATLEEADVILVEDSRVFQRLAKKDSRLQGKSTLSFYKDNEQKRTLFVLDKLRQGKKVALVSSSGTPLISDPGLGLVRACRRENIAVSPIPGPCAFVAAASISGFPCSKILFLGFMPKKRGEIRRRLDGCRKIARTFPSATFVCYQSPYRVVRLLEVIKEVFGDINVFLARELTKVNEEGILGKASDLVTRLEREKIRGEFTIAFNLKNG